MARRAQQRIPINSNQATPVVTNLRLLRRQPWDVMASSEILTMWEGYASEVELAPRSHDRYRRSIVEWMEWLAAREPGKPTHGQVARANRQDVQLWLAHLETTREILDQRDGQGYLAPLSPSARKNSLAAVRHLYRSMMHNDPNWSNDPTAGVSRPKVKLHKRDRDDVLTREELRRLLDYDSGNVRSARQRVIVYLLAYTGCRVQEVADLRWHDVDLERSIITVVGKGDKERDIDILPQLKIVLAHWRVLQLEQAQANPALATALSSRDTALVLLTDKGKPMAQSSLWRTLKRRAHNAGVRAKEPGKDKRGRTKDLQSEVSPHMLRRTLATILLEEGVALDAVADILGHENTATTRRHYTNPRDDRRREAMEKFRIA